MLPLLSKSRKYLFAKASSISNFFKKSDLLKNNKSLGSNPLENKSEASSPHSLGSNGFISEAAHK